MNINKLFKSLSIRNKFLIAFLSLSIIPTLLVGLYGLRTTEGTLVNSVIQQREHYLGEGVEKLKYISESIKNDLLTLCDSPLLLELIAMLGKDNDRAVSDQLRKIEEEIHSLTRKKEYLASISYLNEKGEEIFEVYSNHAAKTLPRQAWLQGGFRKTLDIRKGETYIHIPKIGRNYIMDIHEADDGIFQYSSPVYDTYNRKRGILSFAVPTYKLLQALGESHSNKGEVRFVSDNSGNYLLLGKDNKDALKISPYISRLLSGLKGVINEPKDDEIIVYSPVYWNKMDKKDFWVLGVAVPKKAIMNLSRGGKRFLRNFLLIIMFFSTILGILAARQFSNPIRKLRDGVKTIAKGNFSYRVPEIETNDELEGLANDFNEMAESLRVYTEELDRKIEERTTEIGLEKQKLDSILSSIGAGLSLIDRNLKVVWSNERFSRWFGNGRKIEGSYCYKLYHQTNTPCKDCPAILTLETGELQSVEKLMTMPDGKRRFLLHTTAPIKDETGEISHILQLTQDITWKKLLEQQVIHQEKMAATGVFAASMAHEIGNPLNSIYAIVQLLQRKVDDPFTQENLKLIRMDIGRISRIVQDLVGFSRTPSQELKYVQLNDIIMAAVGITRYDKRARNIQWVTHLEPYLPRVKIIGDQVLQVCLNLILNALDAMDGIGGTLIIKSRKEKEKVAISFSDTGRGMSRAVLERIFDPFFTTKEIGKGTGLGLAVSYGIIKNFKGSITVESEEGKGTTFIIRLPFETGDSRYYHV